MTNNFSAHSPTTLRDYHGPRSNGSGNRIAALADRIGVS